MNRLLIAQVHPAVTAGSKATWQSMLAYQQDLDRHASLSMNRL